MIALLALPRRDGDSLLARVGGGWLTTKIYTTGFVVVLKWQRVVHKRPLLHDVHIILRCFCRLSTFART